MEDVDHSSAQSRRGLHVEFWTFEVKLEVQERVTRTLVADKMYKVEGTAWLMLGGAKER